MATPVEDPIRPATSGPAPAAGNRRWAFWPLLLLAGFLLVALFGERGVLRELQYRRQKQTLEQELQQVEAENQELRREIEALRNNPRYIESIARRELGMVKPDEIIYQFPAGSDKLSPKKVPTAGH